ncbi:MAG: acetyl-CoA carboxylase biotin carboxylase subunit [Planctomycetes bacterium]|nr:acetyl-CoA carboxylase biotin carboxylase subunit [Planctomycetota bacterium]MBI3845831.1 acetyl-CoA carboxylase biotin carboxylase subunit [Planctomycetota bacterium]
MFSRILIANRGEIALRIIRACKELGIETVAVYSEADSKAIYLRLADDTVCIGPAASAQSYLDIPRLISAAEIADVESIHPGYGFLSENARFAEVCRSCNIGFIGPSPEAILLAGNKVRAKEMARKAKVQCIPGSDGPITADEEALKIARKIGYPVIIKAAAGGGGRGMRVAHNDISLQNGIYQAKQEAEAAFKDGSVYIERYIEKPRHIEFQILGDTHGNIVHLGERDCTLQRRYQKLVEEAPSPVLSKNLRKEMGEAAVKFARAIGYSNAGTVEFLLDRQGRYYFIEMNARIQVEHPVTEMVTGIDLVKEQLRLAAGEKLGYSQRDIEIHGHAIECRINAEDPRAGFKPSPGRIGLFWPPGGIGVRVDSHAFSGYEVPPNYDSMIGKLIVHSRNRNGAILTMRRSLDEFIVEGLKTTIPFYREIFAHSNFIAGDYDTSFIDTYFSSK